jgi:hypothetical protein
MRVIISTQSGSRFTWNVNEGTIERLGDRTYMRTPAWQDLRNNEKPVVGERWRFSGWPGELRHYGERNVFSPWCAAKHDSVLTSPVTHITIMAEGVIADVSSVNVCSIKETA